MKYEGVTFKYSGTNYKGKALNPQMSMYKRAALIVSHLTSAPLYSLYMYIYLIAHTTHNILDFTSSAFLGFIFLTLIPTVLIVYDAIRGRTDIFVSNVSLRLKYLAIAMASYICGAIALYVLKYQKVLTLYMVSHALNTLILFLISMKGYKISIHAAGVGGPTTFAVYFLNSYNILIYLLIIPVAWARYVLRAHTLDQLILGFTTSSITTYLFLLVCPT